jgi:hypothetical protein
MTKIAFGVNDRSGFLRARFTPLNLPEKNSKHSRRLAGAIIAALFLGAAGLIFLLAK